MKTGIIRFADGRLYVPDHLVIPFIEGDGTGPDIWAASVRVFNAAVEKAYQRKRSIRWKEVLAGEKAYRLAGEWLPGTTLEAIRTHLVAIKGPLTTPVGGGIRSLNVALRQELDLYVCLRPVKYYQGVPSPVKNPALTNMVIFRENSEDIYAGIEWMQGTPEAQKILHFLQEEMGVKNIRFPETSSVGIKPVSREGTERLVRAAIRYAIHHHLPSVPLVHKGNIMKFTEGGFKMWGYELAEREFAGKVFTWNRFNRIKETGGETVAEQALKEAVQSGMIIIKDSIADAFLQQILTRPADYSVIATLNLNGDYISDALAAIVGGIGIAPGANINYETGHAVFEATHGTAPKYAGKDMVNPGSLILSGVMMLEYIGWKEAADLIVKGLEGAISTKRVTYDLERLMDGAKLLKTSQFADEIIRQME